MTRLVSRGFLSPMYTLASGWAALATPSNTSEMPIVITTTARTGSMSDPKRAMTYALRANINTALPMFLLASPMDVPIIRRRSKTAKCREKPSMQPGFLKWNIKTTIAAMEPSPVPRAQPAAPNLNVSGMDRRQLPTSCAT